MQSDNEAVFVQYPDDDNGFKTIYPYKTETSLGYADAYLKWLPGEVHDCLKRWGYDNHFLVNQAVIQMKSHVQEFDRYVTFAYPHGVGRYVFLRHLCKFIRSKLLDAKSAKERKPSLRQPKQLLFSFRYE